MAGDGVSQVRPCESRGLYPQGLVLSRAAGYSFFSNDNRRGVWVAAFAGTTIMCEPAYGVLMPNFFSASSIRCGGCILMTSACPVSSRLLRLERIAGQP